MVVILGLVAAAVYGAADFVGGLASRRVPAAIVVFVSQAAGLAVLALAWPFVPGRFFATDVGWGIAAGVAGALGIGALYAALAIGRMGIVSPITAVVGASVPVVAGLVLGERPGAVALGGVALAFVAVALVSANRDTFAVSFREPGLGLALLSGLGIGALYVCLARGHREAGLAMLAITRATSLAIVGAVIAVRREPIARARIALPSIVLAGVLDMSANVLYLSATRAGMLAIAAVLTSLYPASTVFLARVALGERLARVQWIGVGLAFAGVVMIAA